MNASLLRIVGILISGWAIALGIVSAQEVPPTAEQNNGGQLKADREKAKEDEVAKLFESIREGAKLPHLKRIGHRDSLEQRVCTTVLTGERPTHSSSNTYGFYDTANPASVSPELSRVALFNNLHSKGNPSWARYSVAVWSFKDARSGELTYSVGVQLFWSAGMEFLDYHFTDDIYYHNDWKKSITPACRNK